MKLKVSVNPNPFTSELVVLMHGHFPVNTVIRLVAGTGKVIRMAGCIVNKGENKIKINNLGRFAAGNYYLEVKLLNGDLLETIGLLKV